jgi:SprT protein
VADLDRVTVWARALIRMHLDPVFDEGTWSFGFDSAKRRAGLCNYSAHRITVSRHLASRWEDDEIYQILLHEIAHALAGPKAGHGATWKRIASELGYEGGRTFESDAIHELAPWRGVCPAGHPHARFRRPTRETSCGMCSRGFSHDHLITWRRQIPAR